MTRRQALLGLASTFVSCMHSPPLRPDKQAVTRPARVIVIAIDGVRYQDVFGGARASWLAEGPVPSREELVPTLVELERRGAVLGAPGGLGFYASGPNFVSLPGYMEILSGSSGTGCTENDCVRIRRATLLDEFFARSGDPTRSAVFSSWPQVSRAASGAFGSGVVSAGPFEGTRHDVLEAHAECRRLLEAGRRDVLPDGLRRDDATAGLALAYLRAMDPDFLFLSLGETDEHAHAGDYPGYLTALQRADGWVARFFEEQRRAEVSGRPTALFVTTDHGRSYDFNDHGRSYPESSRSFLIAAGSAIRPVGRLPWSGGALRDIAPTVRLLTGLDRPPRDASDGRVLNELVS